MSPFSEFGGQMVDKWWTRIEKHAGLQVVLSCGAEGGIRTHIFLENPRKAGIFDTTNLSDPPKTSPVGTFQVRALGSRGLRKSAVADWQRSLFADAKVSGNARMFRHTVATGLLTRGVPIEDVAILLGHATPASTAKYDSHFVQARRSGSRHKSVDYGRRRSHGPSCAQRWARRSEDRPRSHAFLIRRCTRTATDSGIRNVR